MKCVLATDGTESSLKAATWLAENICLGAESDIYLVYVFPIPSHPEVYSELVCLPKDGSDEAVKRIAEPIVQRTREALGDLKANVYDIVLVGNPAHDIVETAMVQKADLIVTGTRGLTTRSELCLGSTSNAVAHLALCPVAIVR